MLGFRGDLDHPGYLPGRVYGTTLGTANTSVAIALVDTIYLYPFRIFYPVLVKTLIARVVTGGANSEIKCGVYENSGAVNQPVGAPVIAANTGYATATNNTYVTMDVTDTVLSPGWYWMGTKAKATLPTLVSVATNSQALSMMGSTQGSTTIQNAWSFADAYAGNMRTFSAGDVLTVVGAGGPPIIDFST